MYLSKEERNDIIEAYGFDKFIEEKSLSGRAWYVGVFFTKGDKHYVPISADFLDFYYDHFPALLRFNNFEFQQIDFVLRREVNSINPEKNVWDVMFWI